jgi:hypothetical protein
MYVSVPPRFGVSAAAAGPAIAATQSAVPRLAAANPDVLIIASLRCCWSGSFSDNDAPAAAEASKVNAI